MAWTPKQASEVWKVVRDVAAFVLGCYLLVMEQRGPTDRLYLVAAAVTAMGLPFVFRGAESKDTKKPPDEEG